MKKGFHKSEICSKCKIKTRDGKSVWCKSCKKTYNKEYQKSYIEVRRKYWINHKEQIKTQRQEYRKTSSAIFSGYKSGAKVRNVEFSLTFEQFESIIKKPCEYCGEIKKERYNGIDRIDSNKGYTLENTVASCGMCNYFKLDYTKEEFINHCIKITQHTLTKNIQYGKGYII